MRGRKKNRAEKYLPSASLEENWAKAWWGEFDRKPPVSYVAEIVRGRYRGNKWLQRLNTSSTAAAATRKLLEYISDHVIAKRRWDHLAEIGRMFAAADRWCEQGFPAADPVRSSLLTANDVLHALAYYKKIGAVRKADLLRLWRKIGAGLGPEESQTMEDADAFRLMRELGLPRHPEGEAWDVMLRVVKPVWWKIKF